MGKSVLLLRTLDLLRTRQGITVPELAQELERSERTVYRYLADLGYELNAPVYCEEGVYRLAARNEPGGVFSLTTDEALATHIALDSMATSAPGHLGPAARSALRKIESTIRNHTFDQLRDSEDKHLMAPSVFSNPETKMVSILCDAVKNDQQLRVTYRSQRSARVEILTIDPYGIAFRRHNWYLVSYSHKHGRVIQLKLVRIQEAEPTGETFQRPEGFSLQDFYRKSWEVWAGGDETTVKILFSARIAPMMRESCYHPTQQIQDTNDGGTIFTATVAGTEEIASWVLSYGAEAEVLEPQHLREAIHQIAQAMLCVYNSEDCERS